MMKNRVLSILLTIVLSFSLVACTQTANEPKGKDKDAKETTELEEETTTEAEEETTLSELQGDVEKNVVENVEEARFARDMTMLSEFKYAITLALASDYFEELKVNPNPVQVNDNGEIIISELFDTSNSDGEIMVEEVEIILGTDIIHFTSELKDDCTLQIVRMDAYEGNVVIQLISEEHKLQYYFDYAQHEGIYKPYDEEDDEDEKETLVGA